MKMMDAEKRLKSLRQMLILFWGILAFVTVWFTLHMGVVKTDEVNNPLIIMKMALAHVEAKPLAIMPFNRYSVIYSLVGITIVTMAMLYAYVKLKLRDADLDAAGSAKWNTDIKGFNKKYNTPFGDPNRTNGFDNVILAKDLYQSMSYKRRNVHSIVYGGSGAGKSYGIIKPNALQMNASFLFTDPKGELYEELAHPLEEEGFEVKVFNLGDMTKSLRYNPYAYIRDENGVASMVQCIIDNTKKEGTSSGDQIWDDTMTILLEAVSFFMIEKFPPKQRNLANALRIIRLAEVDENNSSSKSRFDNMFEALEEENKKNGKPESMATKRYKEFRISSGKTLKSILTTTLSRLGMFDYEKVQNLTEYDEMHLEELGRKKQALFVIIPAANKKFNFLAATMYSQMFETLYYLVENKYPYGYFLQDIKSDRTDTYLWGETKEEVKVKADLIPGAKIYEHDNRFEVRNGDVVIESFLTKKSAEWWLSHAGGKIKKGTRSLPYNLRCMLDEFANTGKIPSFIELISTMRSYKIWVTMILQHPGQLNDLYGEDGAKVITGNCDNYTFLGSQEKELIETIEGMLAKTTKKQRGHSIGGKMGGNESYNYTQSNLMDSNLIREMDDNDCIIFFKGERPFFAQKYDYSKHPKYYLTGAANPDFQGKIPFNIAKDMPVEKSIEIAKKGKQKKYESSGETPEKVIAGPKTNTNELMKKICEGKPEKAKEYISIDSTEEKVEKENTQKIEAALQEAEEEKTIKQEKQEVLDDALWNTMM